MIKYPKLGANSKYESEIHNILMASDQLSNELKKETNLNMKKEAKVSREYQDAVAALLSYLLQLANGSAYYSKYYSQEERNVTNKNSVSLLMKHHIKLDEWVDESLKTDPVYEDWNVHLILLIKKAVFDHKIPDPANTGGVSIDVAEIMKSIFRGEEYKPPIGTGKPFKAPDIQHGVMNAEENPKPLHIFEYRLLPSQKTISDIDQLIRSIIEKVSPAFEY